jgi:hypothetical protein
VKKICLFLLPLVLGCRTTTHTTPEAALAREIFGMTFAADVRPQSSANMSGLRTEDQLFSRRRDSRTFFVQDRRVEAGARFGGSDARLLEIATGMLRRAGIPESEIASPRVLQERLQHATLDRGTKKVVRMEQAANGTRIAHVSRSIGGIPVFTSRLVLTVGADERPSFAELHWPEIPADVVSEAGRLRRMVAGGWQPPQRERVRVESIDAGIVHSPAASFVMDVAPVIRVIYASENGGKKPMFFYDGNGRVVTPPRTFPSQPAAAERARTTKP